MVVDCWNPVESAAAESPYEVLLTAALSIPFSHYLFGLSLIVIVFLYNFLEIHILQDLLTGLRGQKVVLTFNPSSQLYRDVVSKCRILHGRYLSTPWLCSPHLQTVFLHFFGNSPVVNYRRQIFITSDGGTLALDWVKNVEVKNLAYQVNGAVEQDDKKPIMIIIPGLTSDSNSASDCFYNAGWTEDVRKVIDHVHLQFPEAPLFLCSALSIGANILVKYLQQDWDKCPYSWSCSNLAHLGTFCGLNIL
ncbi:hypothetical protein Salat_1634700 [Sesamum alatum]|uniref:Uncharacterized protein n=1 Tax=Sesamum alatum TaxID=300844 RepID=A0AAE2CJF9_9LAMI|nr:hypothetical protein Salat_1634700 [Sesamum alatum]